MGQPGSRELGLGLRNRAGAVAGELADSGEEMAWRTLVHRGSASANAGWSSTAAPPGGGREQPWRKQHFKQGESELKAFDRLRRQDFACEADARAASGHLRQGTQADPRP